MGAHAWAGADGPCIGLTLYQLDDIIQGNLGAVVDPLIAEHQTEQLARLNNE